MVDFDVQSFDLKPYDESDALSLQVSAVHLSGGNDPLKFRLPEQGLRISSKSEELPLFEALEDHPLDHWREIELQVEVMCEVGPPVAYIQATCEKTRYEKIWSLESSAGARRVVKIPTASVRDLVAIRAVTTDSSGESIGLIQNESPFLLLRVDRPSMVLGGGVRAEWSEERFVSRKGLLTYVDFTDLNEPVVYLNDRISDFRTLLTSRKRGVIGALRGFLLSQIEADIWLSLGCQAAAHLQTALADANLDLEDEDLSDENFAELTSDVVMGCLRTISGLCGGKNSANPVLSITRQLMDNHNHEQIRSDIAARKKGGVHSGKLESLIEAVASSSRS